MDNDSFLSKKWDERYKKSQIPTEPAIVLNRSAHLLATSGKALDLACGLGGNAIFLARRGYQVDAWDLSGVAVEKLSSYARDNKLSINAKQVNLNGGIDADCRYDVIVVSYYLDRQVLSELSRMLANQGLLFYQTFAPKFAGIGPDNPDFRLKANELLDCFSDLDIRYYREDGNVGNLEAGLRDVAMVVAQKIS